jgi:hypothetical protein
VRAKTSLKDIPKTVWPEYFPRLEFVIWPETCKVAGGGGGQDIDIGKRRGPTVSNVSELGVPDPVPHGSAVSLAFVDPRS